MPYEQLVQLQWSSGSDTIAKPGACNTGGVVEEGLARYTASNPAPPAAAPTAEPA
ncbi:hypothetical protein M378DRAFT_10378 [Amanita muscaria Koide BX008]|uniref:Uncharacterized protein n=1 Tax=Amanita muscaria (strain Koide BX008) TaxID=946122 RepID=A0A0C2XB93_AMAMK|nr:hypothetical protein M378DRAFT_10378 [Amanita muscaria Koide BX008]